MPRALSALYASAAVLTACGEVGPAEELSVHVSASPESALVGDTIELVGIAHNGSDVVIEASQGCGPGIWFTVTDSLGSEVELRGPTFCPIFDSNILEPGETDVVTQDWLPPGPGLYRVRSRVVIRDGPTIDSRAQEVRVIE